MARVVCDLTSSLFGELLLEGLCLVKLDVALYCKVNEIGVEVTTWADLHLGGSQMGLDVEVDKAPVLKKGVEANNTAHITC